MNEIVSIRVNVKGGDGYTLDVASLVTDQNANFADTYDASKMQHGKMTEGVRIGKLEAAQLVQGAADLVASVDAKLSQ